jgi:hypothetical protein
MKLLAKKMKKFVTGIPNYPTQTGDRKIPLTLAVTGPLTLRLLPNSDQLSPTTCALALADYFFIPLPLDEHDVILHTKI